MLLQSPEQVDRRGALGAGYRAERPAKRPTNEDSGRIANCTPLPRNPAIRKYVDRMTNIIN